jgi:hypothetical protein
MKKMKPINTFHGTIPLSQPDLFSACKTAKRQDDIFLDFFAIRPNGWFTAREVAKFFPKYELTSVRRAISGWYKLGRLERGELKMEIKGKPNYSWRLAK